MIICVVVHAGHLNVHMCKSITWPCACKTQSNLDHLNVQGCLCHCQKTASTFQLMTVNSKKLWKYSSSMNNRLVLIVILIPGFMLKTSSTFENRVPEEIIEERSRYMWKYCWTPDYGCTFTFGEWLKIGIIQHSIKIILHHANPCNHVLPTTSLVYTLFSPIPWDWDRYIGDKWQLQDTVACSCWLIVGYKHNYICT